jgi:hypothetical protein
MPHDERGQIAAAQRSGVPARQEPEGALLERLARAQAAVARERSEALRLCDELLALPCDEQERAVRRDPRFRSWGLCEELLRRAGAETAGDGRRVEAARLASLTLLLAPVLDPSVHAPAVVQDLEAQAWAAVGGARLRSGDMAGAEAALRDAACHLARGTGDLLVEACLLEFEAAVRQRQGRLREATALLRQAEARYRESGAAEAAERARRARQDLTA